MPKANGSVSGGLSKRAFVPARARSGEMTTDGFSPASSSTARTSSGSDRKSTRLNSSHANISYAVFCLKKTNIKPVTASTHVQEDSCPGRPSHDPGDVRPHVSQSSPLPHSSHHITLTHDLQNEPCQPLV